MVQKLKSKYLVCLSFHLWQVFVREREKIFYTYSGLIWSFRSNDFSQYWHIKAVKCTAFTCFLRSLFWANDFSQYWHDNGFSWRCTALMCSLRINLFPNDFSQCWQEKGLIFKWTAFSWILQLCFCPKDFSQKWHEKGFAWKCTPSTCLSKCWLCPPSIKVFLTLYSSSELSKRGT